MTFRAASRSARETEALGELLGSLASPGLVVALQGPLGAGKTVFTKGVARGLGVPAPRYVSSPTFTIHKSYRGRLDLHHLDLYRLSEPAELEDLGLEDALVGVGVCVIEWPDFFFEVLPPERVLVRFALSSPEERVLEFEPSGVKPRAIVERLAECWRERETEEKR